MARIRGAAAAAIHLLAAAALLAVLYTGCGRVAGGSMDGAALALIALAVLAAFELLHGLPGGYLNAGRTRAAARRLIEFVESPPAVSFPEVPEPLPASPDLRFEAVSFRYRPGDPPALDGVDLAIACGRRIALVGESGAGKSTLVSLAVRFFDPEAGAIRIGGTDIRALGEADLRRAVAVVSQDSHLFSATIRENLRIGRPAAADAELKAALSTARLIEFVQAQPEGLDTWVGEGGSMLSAGQARRLCVARAVLRDAPIWILDEPSEGLDRVTERELLDSLFDVTRGRTVLFITHRMAGLEHMDAVAVLSAGRVTDRGTHAELLSRNRRYADWCARMR
jgi:ATP-binding cassette subfamily C protein CydC